MELSPMRFKDYVWPHNPRTYEVLFERKLAISKLPFGTFVTQDLGVCARVLRGSGEFTGAGAYDEFKRLQSVFISGGAGILAHPVWEPSPAHFTSLRLVMEPTKDYVRYEFEFTECGEMPEAGAAAQLG